MLTAKNNNSADISLGVNNDYFKIKQNSYVFYPDILSAFFRVNYRLKSFKVNAGADCNIAGDINNGDNSLFYKFNYRSKSRVLSDLNLGMLFSITSPAYIFQNLSTNHFQWENDFKKIQSQNINAEAGFFNNLIYLFGSYSNFRNYIYLNENVSPIQSEQVAGIVSVGLKWNTIFFNRIHLSGMISTQKSDAFFVRVPEFNSYSRLSYKNHFFDNALLAEIGIACLFTSSYYSDAFVPSIGQLYIQNKVKTEGYPYFNFFANFTIGSAQIYLKVEHFNNGITGGSSMVGAGYPAPPRTLKFGLIWTLRN